MTELNVKCDKSLWERAEWDPNIGTPCLVIEESYYDGIVEMIDEKNKKIESLERISFWKTIEEEIPKLGEIVLVKLSDETTYLCDYEKSNGIILACLYKCENGDLIFYGYPLDDSYKLSEIEKWMQIPE